MYLIVETKLSVTMVNIVRTVITVPLNTLLRVTLITEVMDLIINLFIF